MGLDDQVTLNEAEKLLDRVSKERFKRACAEHGITRFGVTGINLNRPGQIAKVTAAVINAAEVYDSESPDYVAA